MTEQKNLALSGGQIAVTRPSELFTPRLWKLATEPADGADRRAKISAIARTPALREEAARIVGEIARMLDGRCSNADLDGALQPLLLTKRSPAFNAPSPKAEEALRRAWMEVYYGQLRVFPLAAVRAAVKDLVASHIYPDMPQPAELVKAAEPYATKIRMAHYRLKEALRIDVGPGRQVDREANRKALEEAGYLKPNGEIDVTRLLRPKRPMAAPRARPSETPQEMARRLRGSANEA